MAWDSRPSQGSEIQLVLCTPVRFLATRSEPRTGVRLICRWEERIFTVGGRTRAPRSGARTEAASTSALGAGAIPKWQRERVQRVAWGGAGGASRVRVWRLLLLVIGQLRAGSLKKPRKSLAENLSALVPLAGTNSSLQVQRACAAARAQGLWGRVLLLQNPEQRGSVCSKKGVSSRSGLCVHASVFRSVAMGAILCT